MLPGADLPLLFLGCATHYVDRSAPDGSELEVTVQPARTSGYNFS